MSLEYNFIACQNYRINIYGIGWFHEYDAQGIIDQIKAYTMGWC